MSDTFLYVGMVGQEHADEYMNPEWRCDAIGALHIGCRRNSDGHPAHTVIVAPHAWKYIEFTDEPRGVDE